MRTPGAIGATETEMEKALRTLDAEVLVGVRHGHFQCTVTVATGKRKCRELVISAGRQHKFYIPEDEIK